MNGKFEENLARCAFGDMTPEEIARIEAQVQGNLHAERALAEFRNMRDGLRALKDVPEHQLSNDRLRDAILARGLKSEPASTPARNQGLGAGWIWMPVAAVLLGFGLMKLPHRSPSVEPQIVMGGTALAASEPRLPEFRSTANLKEAVALSNVKPFKLPTMPTPIVRESTHAKRHRTQHPRFPQFSPGAGLVVVNWNTPPSNSNINFDPGSNPDLQANSDLAGPKPVSDSASSSSPIMLIDSNPDETTGAPTATEGTASHVVIGG